IDVAHRGFVVDATFAGQVASNRDAFGQFSSTSALYLPGGAPPPAGSVLRNPDLARTYEQIAREGTGASYRGPIGASLLLTVRQTPPRSLLVALLTPEFAKQRAALIDPDHAREPFPPGVPDGHEQHTTNLTVADRWGNVVEYTFTIEQIGGNAMVVPGRGFLLNNELTDFNFVPTQGSAPDPNLPAPGKRP